jgi:hypothetical protein
MELENGYLCKESLKLKNILRGAMIRNSDIECTPVALFVYKRPIHLTQTLNALRNNLSSRDTDLFIFSDGPKGDTDRKSVESVRALIENVEGFKSVTVVAREHNIGLANSIISGVTSILQRYSTVIVLEDDLVPSQYFLKYMNDALQLYKDDEQVISIHGYCYPVKSKMPDTFFLRGADCWGWATWQRGWNLFEQDGKKLLREIYARKLQNEFNMGGAYPYTKMLMDQVNDRIDSWAIRWHATAFLHDRFTLYPGKSLIQNIGMDRSGTHSGPMKIFDVVVDDKPITVTKIPIEQNEFAYNNIQSFYKSLKPGFLCRIKLKIAVRVKKFFVQ